MRNIAARVQILGIDNNYPSRQTQAIEIRDNIFSGIDTDRWGGNGYFITLAGSPRDITVDHSTIISEHGSGLVQVDGAPVLGFSFTNNVGKHNAFGIIGSGRGICLDTIRSFFPGSNIVSNVLAGGSPDRYPNGNLLPNVRQFEEQFESFASSDFRLRAGSPWRGAGTDGRDLGASFTETRGPASLGPESQLMALTMQPPLHRRLENEQGRSRIRINGPEPPA